MLFYGHDGTERFLFFSLDVDQTLVTQNTYHLLPLFSLQDPNQPLSYQFHYKTDNGLYTVVSYGTEDHVTTVLPSGKEENNYEFEFEIMVTDSLSASTNFHLITTVGRIRKIRGKWKYENLCHGRV